MEESLDEIALRIEVSCFGQLARPLRLRADDRLHPPAPYGGTKSVRVVARICDHGVAVRLREQLVGHHHFVALTRREREVERAAVGVDDRVEFC